MILRQPGCRACERSSSADCGAHGPATYAVGVVFGLTTAPQRVDVNAPTWSIGLAEAALCADLGCNAVFTLRRGECPRCAGRNFVALETLMVRR